MSVTLAEAAAACGVDKSTGRRAVRSGRISGVRDEGGVWRVEPVELFRVSSLRRAPRRTPHQCRETHPLTLRPLPPTALPSCAPSLICARTATIAQTGSGSPCRRPKPPRRASLGGGG